MRLTQPLTGSAELQGVAEVLASGYLTQGPKASQFEALVADYVGTDFAFATSSCTTALNLSLVALGIRPGDEVVVPDFTFPATANAVVQLGAIPVLADVDPRTFNMTAETAAEALTDRTRAVIVVHAFGQPADLDPLLRLAGERGLPLVEDAACALGGTYKGRPAGSVGLAGCFSFHPRKIITTGEGGMIVTHDPDLAECISILRSHGGVRRGTGVEFVEAGFNYRLSDVNAAIGIGQMGRLTHIIERRRTLAGQYNEALAGLGVHTPHEAADVVHPYQSYVVRLPEGISRDGVILGMANRGIETTLGTYSLQNQPYFQRVHGYRRGQLPHSDRAFRRTLTLPLYPQMTHVEIDVVSQALRDVLEHAPDGPANKREV